jgi:FKBP-type peptidyl-prolyl cis-trans isomerase SlyD
MTQKVEKNKLISITYSILSDDNEVIEQNDIPIDFIYGVDDRIFPKIIMELEGKSIGDSVEVVLPPEDAFGFEDPELVIVTSVDSAPPEYRVIGAKPTFQNEKGETLEMTVTKIEDGQITVNGNHPFAGKTLRFVVSIIGVRDAGDEGSMDFSHSAVPPTLQ